MDLCNPKEIKALLGRHSLLQSKGQNFIQSCAPAGGGGLRRSPKVGVLEIAPASAAAASHSAGGEGGGCGVGRHPPAHPGGDHGPLSQRGDCPRRHFEAGPACLSAGSIFPACRVVVCANLPYNITTPVITALLQSQCFQAVTVMIQREVAKRICAQPGTAEYGAFTLLCQYYAHCEVLFDVPPSLLPAAPKVTSSVIRMTVREAPPCRWGPGPLFPGGAGEPLPSEERR